MKIRGGLSHRFDTELHRNESIGRVKGSTDRPPQKIERRVGPITGFVDSQIITNNYHNTITINICIQ